MSMTVAQLVTAAQEFADAAGSPRWSTTTIAQYVGFEQWRAQARLLNANNQYYVNGPVTVSPNVSTGEFSISDLTTGSGDSAKNFYRVLLLGLPAGSPSGTTGPLWYREAPSMEMYPPTQPSTVLPYVWYQKGTVIQTLPVNAGAQLQVYCNYRPPRADQLSATSVTVDFPDGYELGLALKVAARMLYKGGSESLAAATLDAQGEDILNDMLMDLGRRGTKPIIARAMDLAQDWGGGVW